MCRHLAYLGPPLPLSRLLFDPPYALVRQAWAPRSMRGTGTINVDGFGVGWFPEPDRGGDPPTPLRYRRSCPLWADPDLPSLAAATTATGALAAVRSATEGMPATGEAACAPFRTRAGELGQSWLFSHNGGVTGWPGSVASLAAGLPVTDLLTLDAPVDSALLWALVRHRLRSNADPAGAVASVVSDVAKVAPDSRLNLLLTDGRTIIANTAGHTLSVRTGGGSVLVSSEPLDDDPAWRQLPDGVLLVATRSTIRTVPTEEVAR